MYSVNTFQNNFICIYSTGVVLQDLPVTQQCLGCICEAISGCNTTNICAGKTFFHFSRKKSKEQQCFRKLPVNVYSQGALMTSIDFLSFDLRFFILNNKIANTFFF